VGSAAAAAVVVVALLSRLQSSLMGRRVRMGWTWRACRGDTEWRLKVMLAESSWCRASDGRPSTALILPHSLPLLHHLQQTRKLFAALSSTTTDFFSLIGLFPGLKFTLPSPNLCSQHIDSAECNSNVKSGCRTPAGSISLPRQSMQQILTWHRWSSGRIVPCHGTDPGSIPGRCT
jgi:hypothetical protein